MGYSFLIVFIGLIILLFILIGMNTAKEVSPEDTEHYELPLTDSSKNNFENIWKLNISGVTHSHDGCNPQKIIPYLPVGAKLILFPEPDNQYDSLAIKVLTTSGKYIGWYPANGLHHKDVFNRLASGFEVNAQLSAKGQILESGRWWCEMKVIVYKN